ncbi:MAG: zinc ribbon domain-containing protein, partial [Mycobacterium sp.]
MSTTPSAPQEGQMMPTTQCRACGTDVPAGAFCGCCGAHLFQESGGGLKRSRIRAFAVAPTEHVLRLSVVTSLFPHLPHRSRAAFRVGLAILVALLVVLGLLRWQAALIAVSTLGFPLLFQLYLQECDAYGDVRTRTLLPAAVIGIGLGVGWALLTGPIVARSDVAMLGAAGWTRVLWVGLAIPLGGAMLMLVPAVIARVFRPPTRESLDGFLVGALGAIVFTAAANLTRLAPQLATGLMAKDRPVGGLLVEAGIDGVAMPLTAAAAGGLVGAALWLTRGGDPPRRRPELVAAGLAVAVVVVVYAGVGLIDVAALAPGLQLGLHLLIAAFAVLVLRFGLHTALLREAREVTRGEPVSCPHCRHVVPEMAFCPSCGVAARASSRSARTARRESAAVPIDAAAKDSGSAAAARTLLPGYVVPAAAYAVPVGRHTSAPRLLVMLGVALAILVAVTVGISALVTPAPVRHVCPPYCV